MSDCMVVRSSRIGSVKDNLSRRMEGRKTRELGGFTAIYIFYILLILWSSDLPFCVSRICLIYNDQHSDFSAKVGQTLVSSV